LGLAQEVDDLDQLGLRPVDARDVVEGQALGRGLDPAGARGAEPPIPPPDARRRRSTTSR